MSPHRHRAQEAPVLSCVIFNSARAWLHENGCGICASHASRVSFVVYLFVYLVLFTVRGHG